MAGDKLEFNPDSLEQMSNTLGEHRRQLVEASTAISSIRGRMDMRGWEGTAGNALRYLDGSVRELSEVSAQVGALAIQIAARIGPAHTLVEDPHITSHGGQHPTEGHGHSPFDKRLEDVKHTLTIFEKSLEAWEKVAPVLRTLPRIVYSFEIFILSDLSSGLLVGLVRFERQLTHARILRFLAFVDTLEHWPISHLLGKIAKRAPFIDFAIHAYLEWREGKPLYEALGRGAITTGTAIGIQQVVQYAAIGAITAAVVAAGVTLSPAIIAGIAVAGIAAGVVASLAFAEKLGKILGDFVFETIPNFVGSAYRVVSSAATAAWDTISEGASDLYDSAKDVATEVWVRTQDTGKWVYENTLSGVTSAAGHVSRAAAGAYDAVKDAASDTWNATTGAATKVWDTVTPW
ncbi:MAG TPA: hypothetical protein VGE45_20710 [Chloroflexia bacterium]|jgi:hypothetical protein